MNVRLKTVERLFLLTILCLVFAFSIISKLTGLRGVENSNESFASQKISIEISGAVGKPGLYTVPQGSTLSTVLRKVKLKPLADLFGFELGRALDESCSIEIPMLKEITIEVSGCVKKNVRLTLAAGSRICDLKNLIVLTEEADRTFLKRKRLLKNREVIEVPARREIRNVTY